MISQIAKDCFLAMADSLSKSIINRQDRHNLKCLEKPGELSTSECNISTKFKYNGNSVTYKDMLLNPPKELTKAIKNIVPKIDLKRINQLVDLTSELHDLRKQFIKQSILMRYEKLLIPALNLHFTLVKIKLLKELFISTQMRSNLNHLDVLLDKQQE